MKRDFVRVLRETETEVTVVDENEVEGSDKDIPVNPPPFRGSLPRKSLISRMDWVSCAGDINLPHTPFPPARYPPNKKNQGQ